MAAVSNSNGGISGRLRRHYATLQCRGSPFAPQVLLLRPHATLLLPPKWPYYHSQLGMAILSLQFADLMKLVLCHPLVTLQGVRLGSPSHTLPRDVCYTNSLGTLGKKPGIRIYHQRLDYLIEVLAQVIWLFEIVSF